MQKIIENSQENIENSWGIVENSQEFFNYVENVKNIQEINRIKQVGNYRNRQETIEIGRKIIDNLENCWRIMENC